jgi:predicted signal transduction protein with EAL and GGDEF domain
LRVVAEGVENGETLKLLSELGCDLAQGYFIGKPVPADQFDLWEPPRRVMRGDAGTAVEALPHPADGTSATGRRTAPEASYT